MASTLFQQNVFQGGGVFQMFTPIGIEGIGYALLLDRSPRITLTSLDFTLVDPTTIPTGGDTVEWTHHLDWSGTVANVDETYWRDGDTDHVYVKITASNSAVISDLGAAPFNLSMDPNGTTTFGYRNLTVSRQWRDATLEQRAKLTVFVDGLTPGYEVDVTGPTMTAETYTIMAWNVSFPTWDAPQYELDLGLGEYAAATTGAADGGPLDPPSFPDYIEDTIIAVAEAEGFGSGGGISGGASFCDGFTAPEDSPTIDIGATEVLLIWGGVEGLSWSGAEDLILGFGDSFGTSYAYVNGGAGGDSGVLSQVTLGEGFMWAVVSGEGINNY